MDKNIIEIIDNAALMLSSIFNTNVNWKERDDPIDNHKGAIAFDIGGSTMHITKHDLDNALTLNNSISHKHIAHKVGYGHVYASAHHS